MLPTRFRVVMSLRFKVKFTAKPFTWNDDDDDDDEDEDVDDDDDDDDDDYDDDDDDDDNFIKVSQYLAGQC